jgi:hypothetical protein
MRLLFLGVLLLPTVACHDRSRPPAPTPDQAAQLNDADKMLNDLAQNEEGPEANASSPSNSSE